MTFLKVLAVTLRTGIARACVAAPVVFALPMLAMAADGLDDAAKLLRAGQRDQALESVDRLLASKPKDPQARFLRGIILTEKGDAKAAIETFQGLTRDYPELPEPYNNLAVIYAAQGQYDKARAALEQSIRTHPSYATAYENLGDVYAKLASQAYDRALQLDSANAAAQNKLALVRELVGGPGASPAKPGVGPVAETKSAVAPKATTAPAPPAPKPAAIVALAKPAAAPVVSKPAAAPAPEKPAPTPTVVKADDKPSPRKPDAPVASASAKSADAEVLAAVTGWARAWASQDVDAYLGHYAQDFITPKGESRADWANGRRARVSSPKSIRVEIESPKVTVEGSDRAIVRFRQEYRSDRFRANSAKTLEMVKESGRWLIKQEKVGN